MASGTNSSSPERLKRKASSLTDRRLVIGGVPEHFNYPWHLGIERGIFRRRGLDVSFLDVKEGTGAMLTALKKQEVDLILALTEGLVADICNGSDVRLLGTYVESPLCWAISTGAKSDVHTVEDLRGRVFAISRKGSGSHLMAYVLASQRGWDPQKDVSFEVIGNFKNLRDSVNSGKTAAFMWETFTTKPFHDSGEVRRVGDITTPWPCFMMAALEETVNTKLAALQDLFVCIQEACRIFQSEAGIPKQVASKYGLQVEDAEKWYSTVRIVGSADISERGLARALDYLHETKVISSECTTSPNELIDPRLARIAKDITFMKLYSRPELVTYVYNHLRNIGKESGPLEYTDLLPFDQHHYFGVDCTDQCAKIVKANKSSEIINIGSGLGGPARYLSGKYQAKMLAIELQDELNATARELTERCKLADRVQHIGGDFLSLSTHLRANHYDAIVSWLTILHIEDRSTLFSRCFNLLKPGGTLYAQDMFEIGSLTAEEWRFLREDTFCHYLPTLAEYRKHLEAAGFVDIKLQDRTESFTQFTTDRINHFKMRRSQLVGLHGKRLVDGLAYFYAGIADLFSGGNLGGVQVVATKPLQSAADQQHDAAAAVAMSLD